MQIPTYPKYLLKTEWEKNKGMVAKARHGETGIGAALDQVKAAYDAVGWATLQKAAGNALANGDKRALGGITVAIAKQAYPHMVKLDQACLAVRNLAQQVKAGLSNNARELKIPGVVKVLIPDKIGDRPMHEYLGNIVASSHTFPDQYDYLKLCLGKISKGEKVA
jgi:hypothetical protein